jgi:hypothetical protein
MTRNEEVPSWHRVRMLTVRTVLHNNRHAGSWFEWRSIQ